MLTREVLHVQIVRCPATGRIILTGETDDKVICGCPESRRARGPASLQGLHRVRRLERATLDAYQEQERPRRRALRATP